MTLIIEIPSNLRFSLHGRRWNNRLPRAAAQNRVLTGRLMNRVNRVFICCDRCLSSAAAATELLHEFSLHFLFGVFDFLGLLDDFLPFCGRWRYRRTGHHNHSEEIYPMIVHDSLIYIIFGNLNFSPFCQDQRNTIMNTLSGSSEKENKDAIMFWKRAEVFKIMDKWRKCTKLLILVIDL